MQTALSCNPSHGDAVADSTHLIISEPSQRTMVVADYPVGLYSVIVDRGANDGQLIDHGRTRFDRTLNHIGTSE